MPQSTSLSNECKSTPAPHGSARTRYPYGPGLHGFLVGHRASSTRDLIAQGASDGDQIPSPRLRPKPQSRGMRASALARPIHDGRGLPIRSGGFEWRRVRSFGVFAARTPTLSERVGGMGLGEQGRRPRRSGTARHERGGQRGEEISVWARGGESQADAACHFDDAGGDFDGLEA
jgi:hypothetical protein